MAGQAFPHAQLASFRAYMFASLLGGEFTIEAIVHSTRGIEPRQALSGKPVVDRFHQQILHVPIVLNGIDVELLDRLRLQPSDGCPLSFARRRTVTFCSRTGLARLSGFSRIGRKGRAGFCWP